MWKFKQVRSNFQAKRDMSNYSYDHVIRRMKDVRNRFSDSIIKKHNDVDRNYIFQFITTNSDFATLNPSKLLIFGNTSSILFSLFEDRSTSFYGIDYARNLTNSMKNVFKNRKKSYFITKDFFKNSYKDGCFDLVILNQIWPIIPLEKEGEMLKELKRICSPNSRIVISIQHSGEDTQEWKMMSESPSSHYYFTKRNSEKSFENSLRAYGIGILAKESYNSVVVYALAI